MIGVYEFLSMEGLVDGVFAAAALQFMLFSPIFSFCIVVDILVLVP